MICLLLSSLATALSTDARVAQRVESMTINEALKVVKPEAVALFQEHTTDEKVQMRGQMKNLDRATEILNGMFEDTRLELDQLNEGNGQLLTKKGGALSLNQQNLASAESSLAGAVSRLSEAQAQQKTGQETIESVKTQLADVTLQCATSTANLENQLRLLKGDLNVTGGIIQMVKCEKAMLMQCIFLQEDAEEGVEKRGYYAFTHPQATEEMASLQTKAARVAMQNTLAQVYDDGSEPMLFQLGQSRRRHKRKARSLQLSNTDPATAAGSPDVDPSGPNKQTDPATAPMSPNKQKSKCSLSKSKNCQKFLDQMMMMQGDISDQVSELEDELHSEETRCENEKSTFSQQLTDAEKSVDDAQTEMGTATKEKTQFSQSTRLFSEQISELRLFIHEKTVEWHTKQKELEETMCGIKKIRTEMFKFQGQDLMPQDCEVSDWSQDECSASCQGGTRIERREIISPPMNKGTECPASEKVTDCNAQPCPENCEIGEWEGWTKCTADCGGGIQTRSRSVITEAKYGGESCGETQQTQGCNSGNCDSDCELSDWTEWTACSKGCDTGFQLRRRNELKQARGTGVCPPPGLMKKDLQRCNIQKCPDDVKCDSMVDVMILIDSSGSMGDKGFTETRKFAANLARRFKSHHQQAQVGAILFSGPGTWRNWRRCKKGKGSEEQCGLQLLSPLTSEIDSVSTAIDKAPWIGATTNTAGALAKAGQELDMGGRQDAASVVFVITDGDPNFKRKTKAAAKRLKKSARLVFVPIGPYIKLKNLKKWSSKPVRENVMPAPRPEMLEKMIPDFVSSLCPVTESEESKESSTSSAVSPSPDAAAAPA